MPSPHGLNFGEKHDRLDDESNKRRKIFHGHDMLPNVRIGDLNGDALRHVASYLPKTSRALLGVALTAPPSSWRRLEWRGVPNAASRAVLSAAESPAQVACVMERVEAEFKTSWQAVYPSAPGPPYRGRLIARIEQYYASGWEILDLLDIGSDLASKLTDDDIGATLTCIDARNRLRNLYLTNCSSVLGRGLEPLRHSSALEHLDLDFLGPCGKWVYKHDWGKWKERMPTGTDCSFRQEAFSIIGDILTTEGSNFRRLHLPVPWLVEHESLESLKSFLAKHKHALIEGARCCYFGFAESKGDFAKSYCALGLPEEACYECDGECGDRESYHDCDGCHGIFCASEHCDYDSPLRWGRCDGCGRAWCNACTESGKGRADHCGYDGCTYNMCSDCRYKVCMNTFIPSRSTVIPPPQPNCQSCKLQVFDRLRAENEELRGENVELRRRNGILEEQHDEDTSSKCIVS